MTTRTRTTKKVSRKRPAKRSRVSKKIDHVVDRFQFWSTIGFWGGLVIFGLMHGWLPAILALTGH